MTPREYLLWTQYRPGLCIGDSTARGVEIVIPAFALACALVGAAVLLTIPTGL